MEHITIKIHFCWFFGVQREMELRIVDMNELSGEHANPDCTTCWSTYKLSIFLW